MDPDSESENLKLAARQKAEAELPAPKEVLLNLFEWIDEQAEGYCDHTLSHTLRYIEIHKLDKERVVTWLNKYGGGCDCEVVMNIQDCCPAFN